MRDAALNSQYDLLELNLACLCFAFKRKVIRLLQHCRERGVVMFPIESVRTPDIQAIYWCCGRSALEIENKANELRKQNALYLADCLLAASKNIKETVITHAIPGLSWHQWGEAIDCCWLVEGKEIWNKDVMIDGINGFKIYAEEAIKLGLNAGYFWKNFVDAAHVQLRKESSPALVYSLTDIDQEMKTIFSSPRENR